MERKAMLPAAEKFVTGMRETFAAGIDERARWEKCRDLLKQLIADPELRQHAQNWPVGGFDGKKVDNLLFYEDPDYGFVMNGLIKNPGGSAMIHDHGPAWTIYGLVQGRERIVRFDAAERADGSFDITEAGSEECGPGDIDIVAPRVIHSEYAGEEKSIALIVRSQRSGTFEQYRYLDDGSRVVIRGPEQVPFDLG
jgi:predicted metal-dependent enzyme (double-stranded beta helix superfamily)